MTDRAGGIFSQNVRSLAFTVLGVKVYEEKGSVNDLINEQGQSKQCQTPTSWEIHWKVIRKLLESHGTVMSGILVLVILEFR